jgi:hypothetical protein
METPSPFEDTRALPARSQSTQARLEIKSMQISTLLIERREITDEELELIEMRYRQALALKKLEDLFTQGLLDCM